MPKATEESVLKVIKYEVKHENKISSDILIDVKSAKTIFDKLTQKNDASSPIKGFIQEIKMEKFGFLLYSAKQVSLLHLKQLV